MKRTHILQHNCICTTNSKLTEGEEYILKEGYKKQRIVLEKVIENGDWLRLQCYFPEKSKSIELEHINTDSVYSGMWRIFDPGPAFNTFSETRESKENKKQRLEEFLRDYPAKVTKAGFLQQLSEDQIEQALSHFKKIYDCRGWGEREKNLAYLAWLLGEDHLIISDHLMFHEMGEVEFDESDYEITFESDQVTGVCINFNRKFYGLDILYTRVFKKNN